MIGQLVDTKIKLASEAITSIYKTNYFGRPKGDFLELSLVEAAYLVYKNKICIKAETRQLDFNEFFTIASKLQRYFELKYIVYKDLKERGYHLQPSLADFRLYPRGGYPGKSQAKSYIFVSSERELMSLKQLMNNLEMSSNARKQMILAIVDEESDITYYEVKKTHLHGEEKLKKHFTSSNIISTFLEDRVIVWGQENAQYLYNHGFYGNPLDEIRIQLSLIEAAYLLENDLIQVKDRNTNEYMDYVSFKSNAESIEPEFNIKYRVYRDLREKHMVPKTGFKFGTHFRLYRNTCSLENKLHSEYLVHAISLDHIFKLPILSRAVRLANSVRKKMLFAVEYNDSHEYIEVSRIKM